MTTPRAQANQGIYLAKILLSSWQGALSAEDIPAVTLNQAFLPAVREHLLDAYGWFLLALTGVESASGKPPHSCSELADVAVGKALPGEVREFQRLEADGWLAKLLAVEQGASAPAPTRRSPGNLTATSTALPDCALVGQWVESLESLFQRMSDSLDEC